MSAVGWILIGEAVFQFVIFWVKFLTVAERRFQDQKKGEEVLYGVGHRYAFEFVRGVIERAFLCLGLVSGVPQVLIPFGVLKLQNRIGLERDRDEDEKENARAYFLIGNILTISFAILYAQSLVKFGAEFSLYP